MSVALDISKKIIINDISRLECHALSQFLRKIYKLIKTCHDYD